MADRIERVDVREVVGAVMRIIEPRLAAKRLDSVADIPPDVYMAADRTRVQAILLTLLSNAIDYNKAGGLVMVDVGYPVDGMPADVVMLRVTDGGNGIPIERQEEVFEQSAATHHRDPRTNGPGLATSREWAREMGGDLRVRSDERGSVFTLKLPRAE